MLLLVGYFIVAGEWSVTTCVVYVSTCLGDIGYDATCVEMMLYVFEVPLLVLEVVV